MSAGTCSRQRPLQAPGRCSGCYFPCQPDKDMVAVLVNEISNTYCYKSSFNTFTFRVSVSVDWVVGYI